MKKIIEALLFVSQGPLKVEEIQGVLEVNSAEEITAVIKELKNEYSSRQSPIEIIELAGGWQMATKKEFASYIKKMYKRETTIKLSNSALETLAIIAYKQPVTRSEIEAIRGVESSGVIRTLIEKNIVRICGKKDTVGSPVLYGTTQQFLVYFGLKSADDLPSLEEIAIEEEGNELSEGEN